MGFPGPSSYNPLHPRFLVELPKKIKTLTIPLDYLFLKFMDAFWSPSSHIPDLNGMVTPEAPALAPEVTEVVNDIALNSPDSPLALNLDDPLAPNLDAPPTPQINPWNFVSTITGLATKIRGLLPLIPPFLYQVINSKEKHLQNINVEITATSKKKIYKIEYGRMDKWGNGEGIFIVFEVSAGKPIRLMHDRDAATRMDNFVNPIFPTTSIFERIWKRQEPHTECIITVKDPGNRLLENGTIMQFIPLSKHEGFKIVHKDPTLIKNLIGPDYSEYDYYEWAENSGYKSISYLTVKLEKPMPLEEKQKTETFLLPFEDPHKVNDYFLEITQYQ